MHEAASRTKTNRAQFAKALATLGTNDPLVAIRLYRLARSTYDLLNTLDTIANSTIGFRPLGDPLADTTAAHVRLMLIVLCWLAEFECELIRDGLAKAVNAPKPAA